MGVQKRESTSRFLLFLVLSPSPFTFLLFPRNSMTAEQASSHPLRRKGFALATCAAAAVGVSVFALAAATGDLSGGAKISNGLGGAGLGLFGMRRAAGSPSSSSSRSSGAAAVRERVRQILRLPARSRVGGTELD